MLICFYCYGVKGPLVGGCGKEANLDLAPCAKCKDLMQAGVICMSVSNENKIVRTGGWCVVPDEWLSAIVNDRTVQVAVLQKRVCFLDDQTWDAIGLPR